MKAPSRDPGDFCIAHRAESVLFMPDKAKSLSTPKPFQHVIPFAFFEVGFVSRIIRVGFAFDLNVSFNGYATGKQQPQFMPLPFFVTGLPEEDPVTVLMPLKVFVFEPARAFVRHFDSSHHTITPGWSANRKLSRNGHGGDQQRFPRSRLRGSQRVAPQQRRFASGDLAA